MDDNAPAVPHYNMDRNVLAEDVEYMRNYLQGEGESRFSESEEEERESWLFEVPMSLLRILSELLH